MEKKAIARKSGGRWLQAFNYLQMIKEVLHTSPKRSLSFAPVTCCCTIQNAVVLRVIFFNSIDCTRYWYISKYHGIYQSAHGWTIAVPYFFVSCMGCFTYHSLHFPLQSCWENNVPSHQSSEAEFPSCPSLDSQPSISLAAAWWATASGEFLSSSLSLLSFSLSLGVEWTDGSLASAVSHEPTNR